MSKDIQQKTGIDKADLLRLARLVGTDSQYAVANFINALDTYTADAQLDLLIWATGGIAEFTEDGKTYIPKKIEELTLLSSLHEAKANPVPTSKEEYKPGQAEL